MHGQNRKYITALPSDDNRVTATPISCTLQNKFVKFGRVVFDMRADGQISTNQTDSLETDIQTR